MRQTFFGKHIHKRNMVEYDHKFMFENKITYL